MEKCKYCENDYPAEELDSRGHCKMCQERYKFYDKIIVDPPYHTTFRDVLFKIVKCLFFIAVLGIIGYFVWNTGFLQGLFGGPAAN